MIVGYVLFGAFAGLIASIIALLLGASFWLTFGLYCLVSSAAVLLLPVVQIASGILVDRTKSSTTAHPREEAGNPRLPEPLAGQPQSVIEKSMRILAVDDDPFILELIPIISANAGFSQVTVAASGEEALRLLKSSDMIFDFLLLDISMPGMDGIELCRRVRKIPQYRQTPIVMLTAMRDMQNMGEAYRTGATDYATKPFDIEGLGTRLRLEQEAIHAQRETDATRQEGSENHRRNRIPSQSFELPQELRLQGPGSLVNHTAFSSYLTQLPRKETADVQLFAVIIDEIETIYAQSSYEQFVALLEDIALVAVECFGADRSVMAYTNDATLLIAANSVKPLSAITIESDIERRLRYNVSRDDSDNGKAISVSGGGPVQLHGIQAKRSRIATDRVIALAENRALDKQGRQIAGLLKR